MSDGYQFSFPAHAEPLIREALKSVIERIPLGWNGPMREVLILPVDHVRPLLFTMDESEADCIPEKV